MNTKFLVVRTKNAQEKYDQAVSNLSSRFGVSLAQLDKSKAQHTDQAHRELFQLEVIADFLNDLDVATQE